MKVAIRALRALLPWVVEEGRGLVPRHLPIVHAKPVVLRDDDRHPLGLEAPIVAHGVDEDGDTSISPLPQVIGMQVDIVELGVPVARRDGPSYVRGGDNELVPPCLGASSDPVE